MGESTHPPRPDILLRRGLVPHRTSLEDLVAYQWESGENVFAGLHGRRRDELTLTWLSEAVGRAGRPAAVLDVGCAYGNHLFMLDARLGKPQDVELVGVDLFDGAIEYARAFAAAIPGFANCAFHVADVAQGLPFEDDSFDAVNLADVLEHLERPEDALRELARVARPDASVVVSTPLRDGLFKRAARVLDLATRGRLYETYYRGKGAKLDEEGQPIMLRPAGLGHVSELTFDELRETVRAAGLAIRRREPMSVMSGSASFDEHKLVLAGLLVVEAVHERLRRPSWAHSVLLELTVP